MRGAADLYLHELLTTHNRDLSTWLGNRHAWPEAWNSTWDLSSATLNLTPELTRELVEKLHAVIDMHTDPHMYLFLYHTRAGGLRAQADTRHA